MALHMNEIVLAVMVLVLVVASVSALWLREHASIDEPTTPLTLSDQVRSALLGKRPDATADKDWTGTVAERRAETKRRRAEARKRRDEKKAAKGASSRIERNPLS